MALDCCHAGAISQNPLSTYVHVRGIKWDPFTAAKNPVTTSRTAHISVSMNSLYRDGDHKQHWLLNPDGYILLAGCGPHEIAEECRGEDNKVHGAMSYLLLGILASSLAGDSQITFNSIYHRLRAKLHVSFPRRNPLMLGNASGSFLNARSVREQRGSDEAIGRQSLSKVVE